MTLSDHLQYCVCECPDSETSLRQVNSSVSIFQDCLIPGSLAKFLVCILPNFIMPPPPNSEDHVPTQETLESFSRPLLVKLKPFHVRPSKEHLAIFKGRPLAPTKVPFSKGVIWTRQELPTLGLHYEYGFHISPKLVPVRKFVADRKWRKIQKETLPPYTYCN